MVTKRRTIPGQFVPPLHKLNFAERLESARCLQSRIVHRDLEPLRFGLRLSLRAAIAAGAIPARLAKHDTEPVAVSLEPLRVHLLNRHRLSSHGGVRSLPGASEFSLQASSVEVRLRLPSAHRPLAADELGSEVIDMIKTMSNDFFDPGPNILDLA